MPLILPFYLEFSAISRAQSLAELKPKITNTEIVTPSYYIPLSEYIFDTKKYSWGFNFLVWMLQWTEGLNFLFVSPHDNTYKKLPLMVGYFS